MSLILLSPLRNSYPQPHHQTRLPRALAGAVLPVGRDRLHPRRPRRQPRHLHQARSLSLQMLLRKQEEIQD